MKGSKLGFSLVMLMLAGIAAADGAPPYFLRTDGAALFSMLIFFLATILYSANVEKDSRVVIYSCLLLLGVFTLIDNFDFRPNLSLIVILGFVGVFLGKLLEVHIREITKRYTKKILSRAVFMAILTLVILFSIINMIDQEIGGHKSIFVAGGFEKIYVNLTDTWFNASNQKLTALLVNSKNNSIMISEISVNETIANVTCIVSPPIGNFTIGPKEHFIVSAICKDANKRKFDKLEIKVRVGYEEKWNYEGTILRISRTEEGTLKGLAEV
jgi:hypothetical protein